MQRIITYKEVEEVVKRAYNETKSLSEGLNADYIPYLKEIPSDLFGISVCMTNGHLIEVGDTSFRFGVESISKVFTALLAMEQWSADKLLEMVGADATGMPFNSIMAILLEADHPSTPLVNAGAIAACSMIKPLGDSASKWLAIKSFIEAMVGSKVELLDELYASESQTNYNNRSIAWLLRNYNRIYDDPDSALDLYTRQCSLGVTAQQLSVAAATIAYSGNNPISGEQVFKPNLTQSIISLMSTVGFYENTGDWMYRTGLPAKSGVGGGVMGVVPGVMGITAFAPPLDSAGNSVKSQKAIEIIASELNLNIFSGDSVRVASSDEVFAGIY
ncbi:MAG: glutaminase A [Rikenellaceae bacterium]